MQRQVLPNFAGHRVELARTEVFCSITLYICDVSGAAAKFRTSPDFATTREGSSPSSSPCIWRFDITP